MKVSRVLGGERAFLGEYDTLGDYAKLGNVFSSDGGFKDSPLAGGMIEVNTGPEIFVVANPVPEFLRPEPPAPTADGGGDGGAGPSGGPGPGGGPGGGEGGPAGGEGGPGGGPGDGTDGSV